MSLMPWEPAKFDVLVPDMNKQHQQLVSIMNRLYDRHEAKAGKPELDKILLELRDCTLRHFRDEEAFFDKAGFPGAANHKIIHKKLVEDFTTHYGAFAKGNGEISKEFFNFLRLWLRSHIMHIDRKYGEFVQHG